MLCALTTMLLTSQREFELRLCDLTMAQIVISSRVILRLSPMAIPLAVPAGSFPPHLDFSAAVLSTLSQAFACGKSGLFSSKRRRYSYGSFPAAWASSSMKVSRKNSFCDLPTDVHGPLGTCVSRL